MPRRTAEASRAVREAWIKERELVAKGKGTRDWTPEQQKEILELGKAYYHSDDPDDANDGKAFEGHHMKSAEAYPEYQGDAANIQFLSRPEHQDAHNGDYRNPTNGYFDPVTKETLDFGDNIYVPCRVINLSDPLSSFVSIPAEASEKDMSVEVQTEATAKLRIDGAQRPNQSQISNLPPQHKTTNTAKLVHTKKNHGGNHFSRMVDKGISFYKANKDTIHTGLKFGLAILLKLGADVITSKISDSNGNSLSVEDSTFSYRSRTDGNYGASPPLAATEDSSDDSSVSRDYPSERSSPEEHTVKRHGQHYNTKEGRIWKEKAPYPRGGKHDKE